MDQAVEVQGTGPVQESKEPKKISVLLVLVLTIITFGIYYPVWFLKRRDALNNFKSEVTLNKGVFIGLIVISVISLLLAFVSGFAEGMYEEGLLASNISPILDAFGNVLDLVYVIIMIIECFKVRRIFAEHFNDYLNIEIPFSKVATFFFGVLYLQYKINRFPDSDVSLAEPTASPAG